MKFLKVNTPHVVHEIFADDEAAVINLKTGNYYSLNPTGAEIWSLIEKNAASLEIVGVFGSRFADRSQTVSGAVTDFINRLLAEDLIIESESDAARKFDKANFEAEKDSKIFVNPEMERFADMQELLLLDPIHEVEETGFPHKKAGETNG